MLHRIFFSLLATAAVSAASPIVNLPNLNSVTFYEGTSGLFAHPFNANDPVLSAQRSGNLTASNDDFHGLTNENYDVFYSNADGTFNALGAYLSIEATYTGSGAGLNISAVQLNYAGGINELANVVTSFVSSTGYVPGSELNAVDGNFNTFTALGHTAASDRMRVTVGFQSSAAPEPASYLLLGSSLVALGFLRRRKLRSRR